MPPDLPFRSRPSAVSAAFTGCRGAGEGLPGRPAGLGGTVRLSLFTWVVGWPSRQPVAVRNGSCSARLHTQRYSDRASLVAGSQLSPHPRSGPRHPTARNPTGSAAEPGGGVSAASAGEGVGNCGHLPADRGAELGPAGWLGREGKPPRRPFPARRPSAISGVTAPGAVA